MLRRISEVLSYAFHPLVMATLLVAILFYFAPSSVHPINSNSIQPILLMIFIFTYIIPVLSVGGLKLGKFVSSFRLEKRKERPVAFIFIASYYGLLFYLVAYRLNFGGTLPIFFAAMTAMILLLTLITLFYKISIHSAGVWGLLGFLTGIHFQFPDSRLFWPILIVLILAGAISSARLHLNAHNLSEVTWGSIVGFVISFGAVLWFV